MISSNLLAGLKAHQRAPAVQLDSALDKFDAVVDCSSTGIGKTYVAAAIASSRKLPTLVVVPKIAVTAWERAGEHFGDRFSVIGYEKLRTGRTPFGFWDNTPPPGFKLGEYYVCQSCQRKVDFENFEPCYCHPIGAHCITVKSKPWDYGKFHFHPGVRMVIFDEVHRCNGIGSLNGEMLNAAKRERKKIMGLSATIGDTPMKFQSIGYALDLHTLYERDGLSFYDWARENGCRLDRRFGGFKWMANLAEQKIIMSRIHARIFPKRGVRIRCEDVPGFPEVDISAELYDLDENHAIDALYAEMNDAIKELEHVSSKDLCPDHPLTRILRACQRIELLKVPVMKELAEDYIEKGYSTALFVNYKQTIAELRKRLSWEAVIDGSPAGVKNRQKWIDQFQADAIRGIIVNSLAGGISVSLHDLRGEFPRVGLVMPNPSAVVMRQLFGRLRREGAKSKSHYRVLLAAKTVEVSIHRAFNLKSNNLDTLNDGDLMPAGLKLSKKDLDSVWSGGHSFSS